MEPLFFFKCSASLAKALGAVQKVRVPRPQLSFPVYEPTTTHHALIQTEDGHFAWLWKLDKQHPFVERR